MSTRYKEMQKKLKELEAEITKEGESFFKEESAKLFEKFPELNSFSWDQYTDYFNDGDECHFFAHTEYPTVNELGEDDECMAVCPVCKGETYVDNKEPPFCPKDGKKMEWKCDKEKHGLMTDAVAEFLTVIKNDDYKRIFGDHKRITVTRKGIKIEHHTDHN